MEEKAGWALSFLGEIQVHVLPLCKEMGQGERVLAHKGKTKAINTLHHPSCEARP